MTICIIAGARPNFIKIAPIIHELQKRNLSYYLVNTGQHYDSDMADIFFKELNIPKPNYNLGVGSGSHAKQTAKIMELFEEVLLERKDTSNVLVVGDVNSTMACAITAKKLHIPVSHVEAGLRSFDEQMPEEINRILTDSISDLLLVHSSDGMKNLEKEGVPKHKVKFVGNIMIDSLLSNREKIDRSKILEKHNFEKDKYGLITLHRPNNVDDKEVLQQILNSILNVVPEKIKLYFPIHPRTKARLEEFNLMKLVENQKNIIIDSPRGYFDFQKLVKHAFFIVTDSGGIQEESVMYNTPCLTLRENTERPICIREGTTELLSPEQLANNLQKVVDGNWKTAKIPKMWDGKTAKRIVDELEIFLQEDKL